MERWLEIGLSTASADRAGAEAGIRAAYASAKLPAPALFDFVACVRRHSVCTCFDA